MSTIYTERLTLRPFKASDAEAMYKSWTYDERVAEYCRWYPHESVEVTKSLLKMYLDEAAQGFDYRWAIELTETKALIGAIDVVEISDNGKSAEVGYVLANAYWGRGYMTEALRTVIYVLFSCGFDTVKACHHIDNPASGRVMEKCGMVFQCCDRAQAKFGSDELCDIKRYQIKKDAI